MIISGNVHATKRSESPFALQSNFGSVSVKVFWVDSVCLLFFFSISLLSVGLIYISDLSHLLIAAISLFCSFFFVSFCSKHLFSYSKGQNFFSFLSLSLCRIDDCKGKERYKNESKIRIFCAHLNE